MISKFFWLIFRAHQIKLWAQLRGHSSNTWHSRRRGVQSVTCHFSPNLETTFSSFDHFLGHFWVWNHTKICLAQQDFTPYHKLTLFWLGLVFISSFKWYNYKRSKNVTAHGGGGVSHSVTKCHMGEEEV